MDNMSTAEYTVVDSLETLQAALERLKKAQRIYAGFTPEQVAKIFVAAAAGDNPQRIVLAK